MRTAVYLRQTVWMVTLALVAGSTRIARAQVESHCAVLRNQSAGISRPGQHLEPIDPYPVLPRYEMHVLSATEASMLGLMLDAGCWREARELYFTNYQGKTPDWVVYIDSNGVVQQEVDYASG